MVRHTAALWRGGNGDDREAMVAQFSKGSIIENTRFEGFSPKEGQCLFRDEIFFRPSTLTLVDFSWIS